MASPRKKLERLEARLDMLGWANREFGFRSNAELLCTTRGVSEGFAADGRSHLARTLMSRERLRIPPADLARYDDNVRRHLESINAGRRRPITLRYFQHLAALYAELLLDRRANAPEALARDLNDHVRTSGSRVRLPSGDLTPGDMNKLAFWMATGSGKTLIMHLNYLQFLHYGGADGLDNIILITPNEGLSAQHIAEMADSGVPALRFGETGLLAGRGRTVRVTEITKLVERKKGKGLGVSIEVEALGDRNLVFVDEGHRGASGDAWRKVRDAVAKRGFTFEYSATFGQALAAAKSPALTVEYGKSIVFDYSYRYFHRDGFGKDFNVLNVSGPTDPQRDLTHLLLLGNLLSFYEQSRAYREGAPEMARYNIEPPLWVFVGGSVNAVYKRYRRDTSDVLDIQLFLHRVLNEPQWARDGIAKLLRGESGLRAAWHTDLFERRFEALARAGMSPGEIYDRILRDVFHADGPGGLRLCDIRGAPGEIGLKASGSDHYFGLTYIGDTARFKKLAMAADAGLTFEVDAVGRSVFERVNEAGATVNVLIGAKKFVEGWNSWRVSSMGLMNIGRAEGSEIIQLFGRGVRLKGLDMSLKRSAGLDGRHPKDIERLETLNIFALRADYMKKFRQYLEREGLEAPDPLTLRVPVRANEEFLGRGLVVPSLPDGSDFLAEANFPLDTAPDRPVRVDRATRASSWESGEKDGGAGDATAGSERAAGELPLWLVDWEAAYLDLVEYRRRKGMRPLALPGADELEERVAGAMAKVAADDHVFEPTAWGDRDDVQTIAQAVLRRCSDRSLKAARRQWERERMHYRDVDAHHPNLVLNADPSTATSPDEPPQSHYVVTIPLADKALRDEIVELIEQQDKLYLMDGIGDLSRIHFDRHLYQPLLVENTDQAVTVSPPPLNNSERLFVRDLRRHWREHGGDRFADWELFLLRNQGRGHGVGFSLAESGFYPDFILWMLSADRQRVVFVEPHGMMHANAYEADDKARLHERLPALAEGIARRSQRAAEVTLDSFIISATEYGELRPRYGDGSWTVEDFARRHILFQEDAGYVGRLLGG